MTWSTRTAMFGTAASVSVALLSLTLLGPLLSRSPVNRVIERRLPSDLPKIASPAANPVVEPVREQPTSAPAYPDEAMRGEVTQAPARSDSLAKAETAIATESPAKIVSSASASNELEQIVVTGLRGRLDNSMASPIGVVDSISAEDIGQAPNRHGAEALQRIAGVATDEPTGDDFQHFESSSISVVSESPISTFSVDVDTASYSYTRALLNEGTLPEKDAVRAEEMINYFDYEWPAPESARTPFKATIAVSDSPWNAGKKLVHIGIKGYELQQPQAPDANLVFLVDVSGSMDEPNKLPLVVQSMRLLLSRLKPTDTVAIVVYAGAAGVVLPPTEVRHTETILAALDALKAGGSTAGAEGIKLAYKLAEANYRNNGVNRILLATDGDFNVGITDEEELKGYVERQREGGVFLSVLGFGQGNYHDEIAQTLAQNGNGVAAYIDTLSEAKKVLVEQANGMLFTIAKDVKLQVEFNPATVAEYRLVGYETRSLDREDFNNDAVDAGDIGSGHTVTAIYEITPAASKTRSVDLPRYARTEVSRRAAKHRNEYGQLRIRYKLPDGDQSELIQQPILIKVRRPSDQLRRDLQFSTAVAGFAQLLRGGTYTGRLTLEDVVKQAQASLGEDPHGYRAEFVDLVKKAQSAEEQ